MSFAYMPLFTGDYLRDTRHLTPMKHGIYVLALMYCWDSKGPMPLDEQECAGICNCRSADEVEALRYVLVRYFILSVDGYYNKRISEEVAKSHQLSSKLSDAGKKSGEVRAARSKARAATRALEPRLNPGSTKLEPRSVSPSPSPSPSLSLSLAPTPAPTADVPSASPPDQGPGEKNTSSQVCRPTDVSSQVWGDFLKLRNRMKAAVTDTAISRMRTEANKAHVTLQEAMATCCERGWRGFKAEWVAGAGKQSQLEAHNDDVVKRMLANDNDRTIDEQ